MTLLYSSLNAFCLITSSILIINAISIQCIYIDSNMLLRLRHFFQKKFTSTLKTKKQLIQAAFLNYMVWLLKYKSNR